MKFSKILQQLDSCPTSLCLCGLHSHDIPQLEQSLLTYKDSLEALKLNCSHLRNENIGQLSVSLEQLNHLVRLYFCHNKFIDGRGFQLLVLPKFCRSLNIEGTPVGDDGMKHICTQLPNLETLWARNCNLRNDSIQHILQLKKLKELFFINGNHFTEEGIKLLAKEINKLPLETLYLGYLGETTRSPEITASLLDSLPSSVETLYISYNYVIGNNKCCVAALIRLIERPSSLKYIEMEHLMIEDENVARRIMDALRNRKLPADYLMRNPAMSRLYREQQRLAIIEMPQQEEGGAEGPLKAGYVFEP